MRYCFILLFVLLVSSVNAQTCLHSNLSRKFDYKVIYKSTHTRGMGTFKNSVITTYVINKQTKTITQKISYTADLLFETAFKDCNAVRSYITGKNTTAEVLDYDAGDLIIADINFDGEEDIAIKFDSGGNGGPRYCYYLQDNNGQFHLNRYLTQNVNPFPEKIDIEKKTLIVITHANVMQQSKRTYHYSISKRQWHMVKNILID